MEKRFEPRKLFVGGLPRSGVTPATLRAHFARYGRVVDALVMVYPETGAGRGFGFVEFDDDAAALRALDWKERDRHVFGGRRVEVKRAKTRSVERQPTSSSPNADSKKIFVGGLGDNVNKYDLTNYFERFGTITDVVVMYEKMSGRPRGFGFVTFDSQEATEQVLENRFHELKGTKVETKNAKPREECQYQNGHYHGSTTGGHSSPANSYGGMYSPHGIPYVPYNGPYLVHPYQYVYAPHGIVNYGYMMSQMATSNDSGMIAMQGSPMMYADYEGSYRYDPVSPTYLEHRALNLGSISKTSHVKGNQQAGIPAPDDMKSDPVKPDSNSLL